MANKNRMQVSLQHPKTINLSLLTITLVFILSGCQTKLMKTPNLYLNSKTNPFANVAQQFRNNKVDVLYVTDRKPTNDKDQPLKYGFGRSASIAYGSCLVEIGKELTWEELVESSLIPKRSASLPISVVEVTEHARFSETPLPLVKGGDTIVVEPEALAHSQQMYEKFQKEIHRRLAATNRKQAYIYIHGFHSPFEDSPEVIAQLWHFMGREGIPIAYTWPAGSKGLLKGYNYDRESGEFTIFHLKQFLKALASCEQLEKIHIVAHSRGTDVATTALRELFIEARAEGADLHAKLKIGNLVLAAPDLDLEVAIQRIGGERFFLGLDRLTIYVSKYDKAIGGAEWLYGSKRRLGQLRIKDIPANVEKTMEHIRQTQIVDAKVNAGAWGHYYFYLSPAVSSDLILVLRDNLDPGAANGRPLTELTDDYWQLNKDYPNYPQR